jgi:hypothetical protein
MQLKAFRRLGRDGDTRDRCEPPENIGEEKEAYANPQGLEQRDACVEQGKYGAEPIAEALPCLRRHTVPWKFSEAGHGLFLSHQRQPWRRQDKTPPPNTATAYKKLRRKSSLFTNFSATEVLLLTHPPCCPSRLFVNEYLVAYFAAHITLSSLKRAA